MSKVNKNILRIGFIYYSYLINLLHLFVYLFPPFVKKIVFKLLLGRCKSNVFIDTNVYFRYPNRVFIGDNVSINRGCEFYPSLYHKDAIIEVGNNIRFGPNVVLLAAGHDYRYLNLPDTAGKITIEDNVWIGANATILPGIKISEGSVIGAGAVVSKNTEPYSIYAGIPAKFIKKREIIEN